MRALVVVWLTFVFTLVGYGVSWVGAEPVTFYGSTQRGVFAGLTDQQGLLWSIAPVYASTWTGNFTIDNDAGRGTINGVTLDIDMTVADPNFFDGGFRVTARMEQGELYSRYYIAEMYTPRLMSVEAWHLIDGDIVPVDMSSAEEGESGPYTSIVREDDGMTLTDMMAFSYGGWSFTFDEPAGIPIYGIGTVFTESIVQGIPAMFTVAGDMNANEVVNFDDLSPFADAMTDPFRYTHDHMTLDRVKLCDVSGDGYCDFNDLSPFVDLLTQPAGGSGLAVASRGIPEPSSLLLVAMAALVPWIRW